MAAAADVVVLGLAMVADADADSNVDAAWLPRSRVKEAGRNGGVKRRGGLCVCVIKTGGGGTRVRAALAHTLSLGLKEGLARCWESFFSSSSIPKAIMCEEKR
jgi:hypothetical protein